MRCTLRRPRSSKFPCATPAFIAFTNPLRTLVSLSKGQHLIKPPSAPLPVYSWPRCKQFRLRNEYGCNHSQRPVGSGTSADTHGELSEPLSSLTSCSGCGALAQTLQPAEAGYYSLNRASVKQFIESREEFSQIHHERDQHFARALEHADPSILRALAGGEEPEMSSSPFEFVRLTEFLLTASQQNLVLQLLRYVIGATTCCIITRALRSFTQASVL